MRRGLVLLLVASTAAANPKIDGVMKEWSGRDRPGCAVAVVEAGKTTFAKGYGMADLERDVPITPNTVFDIGSVSKQLTAATIHLLAADQRLALDDDIRKHLPELPALAKRPVTIRQLLHHTGGLRDYVTLLMLTGRSIADVATAKETLAILARQRGYEHEPGTKHAYSNTGYFLLAQIAERAGKQPMAELVRDRLFKPLGMNRSLVLDAHAKLIPGRALAYRKGAAGWQLEMSQWEQTGDGAVQTTVHDLARWDANFYDHRVGGKALVERMLQKGKLADGSELAYASGLLHGTYRELPIVQHGGAWAGYRAELVRFPAQRTSVIVLCNAASANPTQLAYSIADLVLGNKLGKQPPKPAPAAARPKVDAAILDAWVGKFRSPDGVFEIARKGDELVVVLGGNELAIDPSSKTQAVLRESPDLRLELSGTAPRRKLRTHGGLEITAEELATYKPTAAEVGAVAGRYYSPELRVTWTLTATGTALTASGPGFEDPVEVVSRDELAIPGVVIKRVKGNLAISAGRIRDVVFERQR